MNRKRKRPALPPASPLLRYATLLRREGRTLATPGLARRYIAAVAVSFKLGGLGYPTCTLRERLKANPRFKEAKPGEAVIIVGGGIAPGNGNLTSGQARAARAA